MTILYLTYYPLPLIFVLYTQSIHAILVLLNEKYNAVSL